MKHFLLFATFFMIFSTTHASEMIAPTYCTALERHSDVPFININNINSVRFYKPAALGPEAEYVILFNFIGDGSEKWYCQSKEAYLKERNRLKSLQFAP